MLMPEIRSMPQDPATFHNLKKRIGRFAISSFILERDPECMLGVMSGVIVTHAEHRYDAAEFRYVGYSDFFREVPEGEIVPCYEAVTNSDTGVTRWVEIEQMYWW